MSIPREYRGWTVDIDHDWPGADHWIAHNADEEGFTLRAATEKDLMVEIEDWEAEHPLPVKLFEVAFGNPRKEWQVCYQFNATDKEAARKEGIRRAARDMVSQRFHAVYEVRS